MKARLVVIAAVLAGIATPASAMSVDTFLAKASALKAKGVGALFASDYRLLKRQIQADGKQLKAEREAARAAGRMPAYCPPGPIKMSSSEVMSAMNQVPAGERSRTDTKTALRAYFARRFPCRA